MDWKRIKSIMEMQKVPPETAIHAEMEYGEKNEI
jgi:hypothetical protein